MARKSARTKSTPATTSNGATTAESKEPTTATASVKLRRARAGVKRRVRTRRKPVVKAVRKRSAPRRARARVTDTRRQEILQIAAREGLTGAQVAKRFGISQVTYYLWRKKAGLKGRARRGRASGAAPVVGMAGTIRAQVRSAIQAMLPQLISEEIAVALGGRRGRRSRR